MSGVDPTVRQTKPIITARVKVLPNMERVKDMSTNDAEHAGDALTRKVMQACRRCAHEKVLQRFKRCVQVDRDHH